MFYKFYITIYFRNGKILNIKTNNTSIMKDPKGFSQIITVDGIPILELVDRGTGNAFGEGEVIHYTAAPRPKLYDYFLPEWDRNENGFTLIDKIIVNSKGIKDDE
jgi:hypothetical protein